MLHAPTTQTYIDWFRARPDHPMYAVRCGVADVLESGSTERLDREISAIINGDDEAMKLHIDSQMWIWLACTEPEAERCGEILQSALSAHWNGDGGEVY